MKCPWMVKNTPNNSSSRFIPVRFSLKRNKLCESTGVWGCTEMNPFDAILF